MDRIQICKFHSILAAPYHSGIRKREIVMTSHARMRAAIVETQNGPFRIVDVARPEPAKGEVLVRIQASGVNPLDTKIRAGAAAHARHPMPAILGLDLAGTIEATGERVTRFHRGDQVYGMTGGVG